MLLTSPKATQLPRATLLREKLRVPNQDLGHSTPLLKRVLLGFGRFLVIPNALKEAHIPLAAASFRAQRGKSMFTLKFVPAHTETRRVRRAAPPSSHHNLQLLQLSRAKLMRTCEERGAFRAAERSRRDSTSRRGVKSKGSAAGRASLHPDHFTLCNPGSSQW